MKVLVACEESQRVCIAFREKGHEIKKRTCLWLKGLPELKPTNIVKNAEPTTKPGNWYNKGGKDRAKNRSKTFIGIARAMAEQWG